MERTKYQVVFLGSSNVGKTKLFNRMTHQIKAITVPTINFASATICKNLNGRDIEIELWDTAGQERFRSLTSFYTKSANGIFLVFDLSDINASDDELNYIRQQIDNAPRNVSVLIIGNKTDLIENNNENPKIEYIKNKIKHFDYIQTSALNGSHVSDALDLMINQIEYNQPIDKDDEPILIKEPSSTENANSKCC